MGALAAIKQLASSLLVFIYALAALLTRRSVLHTARFARIDELVNLFTTAFDKEASLLLGISHLRQVLRVRPTTKRRELGNLLVVAPARGFLQSPSFLPGATRWSSMTSRESFSPRPQATGKPSARYLFFDPTGVGHLFDPLLNKHTEDELYSAAVHLLFKPDEGDGAIFTQRAAVMLTQLD